MAKPVKITDIVINLPWKNQVFWISLSAGINGLKNKTYISCMLRSENLMLQTKNKMILVQGF